MDSLIYPSPSHSLKLVALKGRISNIACQQFFYSLLKLRRKIVAVTIQMTPSLQLVLLDHSLALLLHHVNLSKFNIIILLWLLSI